MVRSESSPERHEKLFSMLLETIPSSVLLLNRDMRIMLANRNFYEKSLRSASNTIGHRLEKVFPPIILDRMKIIDQIRQVFKSNQPTSGERMVYRTSGGTMRIYYYRILPFSWDGFVESAILLMEDVSEQQRLAEEVRRIERHLASVIESASDIVLSTDIEGRILTWNRAAERLADYTINEVKSHYLFEYCAPEHQKEIHDILENMTSDTHSRTAEWHLVTKHGDQRQVSWVLSQMRDDSGRTVGFVAVGRDLTEQRKFEKQLHQSEKFAALGVLAGGIAHEIRNPLAVCSSAAQFLMDDDIVDTFRKECASRIQTGLQRAARVIEDLLRYSRPSATTHVVEVDLLSLLRETMALIVNQARIQKIKFSTHFPKDPIQINCVMSLLQQVFMNLFLNAIKAMPNGGTLGIVVEQMEGKAVIHVSDTGHGIPNRDINKIFDPFYSTYLVGDGTGLGLSVCYSILKQHGGVIEVDSVEGEGSTFLVRLPLH